MPHLGGSARLAGFVLALVVPSTVAAQAPAGGEFTISASTTVDEVLPGVAVDPSGAFVAVWLAPDGSGYGVRAQRCEATGVRRGAELQVNTYTTANALFPAVATDSKGGFVVVWHNAYSDGSGDGVRARRFDAAGVPRGADFVVNSFTTQDQRMTSVVTVPGGGFTVVWQSETQDGSGQGIVARRFDPSGTPLTDDFVVNTFTTDVQASPSIAAAADGRTVVVWSSFGQDGAGEGVFGQRFDAAGNRLGAEFQVNASSPGDQIAPRVAAGADGSFVVVWQHFQGATRNIGARRFDSSGTPLGGDFVVQTLPDAATYRVALAADASTNFVVVWQTFAVPGDPGFGLRQQRFFASGAPRGFEIHTNTFTAGDQVYAAVASDPAGNLVTMWMSDRLGPTFDIAVQRWGGIFPSALAVDTAGNGVLEPGDTADLRPSWRNLSTLTQILFGALTALTGPAGATYTITDGAADYGTVSPGVAAACADCYGLSVSAPPVRPMLHWDAVATELIALTNLGQVKRWSLHIGDSFTDVPRASSFYRFVETLLHHSVTAGCGGGAYCPASSTTREQMAVFVLVAKEESGYAPPACTTPVFADVPASSPFCRWVEELARRGVTGGCGGGNYCPAMAVSREQMAVFVLRTLDPTFDPPPCTTPLFDDVPISSPFCRWIEELARRGIVSGCGGGNYCPTAPVTREQMSVFLTGTFGLTLYGP